MPRGTTLTVPAWADSLTAGCHCHLLPAPAAQPWGISLPAPLPALLPVPGEASGTRGVAPGLAGPAGPVRGGRVALPAHRPPPPAPAAPGVPCGPAVPAGACPCSLPCPCPTPCPTPRCSVAGGRSVAGEEHRNARWQEGTVVTGAQALCAFPGRGGGGSAAGRDQRDNLSLSVEVSVAVPRGGNCSMPSHAMKDIWYGMVLAQDCWHNLGKHCQHACGRHRGPLSCCHHSHQSCHHHSGAGLGQGHRECLVVPAQCMPPSPCRTGSIALLSQGHGTALQGPPTLPLSPGTRWQ